MQGLYRIYKNELLIHEFTNVITTQGKNRIRQILSGKTTGFASSILVGVGDTAPTINDTKLSFAVEGSNIMNTMVDDVNNKVYFKTSLPVEKQYKIYELGCYSANSATAKQYQQNALLITFGEITNWTDTSGTHSLNSTNTRLGISSIRYSLLAAGVGRGSVPFQIDLSQLLSDTEFTIAYFANNIDNLKIRFKNSSSDYWEATIIPSTNNAYNISSVAKSSFVATGAPDWSSISNLEIQATATGSAGTIDLDSIRYDAISTAESILLSRALPSSPILKPSGSTMDIEYVLEGIV